MSRKLIEISRKLARNADALAFGEPVSHVYNPLTYARLPHELYLGRFDGKHPHAVLVGMNPGPFGMAQTGVPFGDVAMVRDFLGIDAPVTPPRHTHPKRPVEGFQCGRSEVSGTRLWGYVKTRFKKPDSFFERFFIANYCPLVFVEPSGKNRTPDKLPAAEQAALFAACDGALKETVLALDAKTVIGIGAFAESRIRVALKGMGLKTGRILHPSPASPAANRGWAEQAEAQLQALGLI
jgi:single-strand selective monofunctional uracil DNA glycosylase